MSLFIIAVDGDGELLSRVISYSMDPVQDEGTVIDVVVEGTSVDLVSSDGISVNFNCFNDNMMIREALSVVEDMEEEISLFKRNSFPMFSTVEDMVSCYGTLWTLIE